MDAKQENELFKTLGRIESKVEGMCSKNKERHKEVKELHDKMDTFVGSLPCHAQYQTCQDEIKKKASGSLVKVVAIVLFSFACSAFAYTYIVDTSIHDHAKDYEVHYMDHDKENERGGE